MLNRRDTLIGLGQRPVTVSIDLRVDVLVSPLAQDIDAFWARAREIGHEGMFLSTHERLQAETLLMLELVFPTLSMPKLRVDAQIVHTIPGAGFGCRFVAVSERLRGRLSELIATISSAPVEKRRRVS
jgi:hypothetical protein